MYSWQPRPERQQQRAKWLQHQLSSGTPKVFNKYAHNRIPFSLVVRFAYEAWTYHLIIVICVPTMPRMDGWMYSRIRIYKSIRPFLINSLCWPNDIFTSLSIERFLNSIWRAPACECRICLCLCVCVRMCWPMRETQRSHQMMQTDEVAAHQLHKTYVIDASLWFKEMAKMCSHRSYAYCHKCDTNIRETNLWEPLF